jgi:putative ABC transport system ATP-binding protein
MSEALLVRDLRFAYREGFGVSVPELSMSPGEHVLLKGASGCGKSTFLNLLAGLLDAEAGEVSVGGESITKVSGAARDAVRGRRIGMVFQTHQLLSGFTARENLQIALLFSSVPQGERAQRAEELLGSLGLERMDAMVERLSVGQQQRVAVARALVGRPALVLADEPTASLDPDHARQTMTLMREAVAREGAALLCTSHDPSLIDHFERVIDYSDLVSAEVAS